MILEKIEKSLIQFFSDYETIRMKEERDSDVIPRWMLKHRIQIICNGETVFDSYKVKGHRVPLPIQYSIKKYGLPDASYVKRKKNKPIVYNIDANITAID